MTARNLHRLAGVLDRLRREAIDGDCALRSCDQPAISFIESWDARPCGICAHHVEEAKQRGYTVYYEGDLA